MQILRSRAATALFFAVAATLALGACRTASSTTPAYLTADNASFVVHGVERYPTQNANDYNNEIIVIDVTYTNTDPIPQTMSPSKFMLIDQTTLARYQGLDGGDIHVPTFPGGVLDPGKKVDLSLAFRVSSQMTSAHLVYSP